MASTTSIHFLTEPPQTNLQWRATEWLLAFGPLTHQNLLDYFAMSPFFSPSSSNAQLRMQMQFSQGGMQGVDEEEALKRFVGIEYVVNKEIGGGKGGLFVIEKRERRGPTEVTPLAAYYVLNSSIYQAPSVYAVLNERVLTALHSLSSSFTLLRDRAPKWTPDRLQAWDVKPPSLESGLSSTPPLAHDPSRQPPVPSSGLDEDDSDGVENGEALVDDEQGPERELEGFNPLLFTALQSLERTMTQPQAHPPVPPPPPARSGSNLQQQPVTPADQGDVKPQTPATEGVASVNGDGKWKAAVAKRKRATGSCIIFYSDGLDRHSLVLAANRDEFLARPTTTAAWHNFSLPASFTPDGEPSARHRALSGLDLEAGGTWLGISLPPTSPPSSSSLDSSTAETPRLRFSTLTNFTETLPPSKPPRPSRGNLVKDFLEWRGGSFDSYLSALESSKHEYAGFNLLLGELLPSGEFTMGYASNREFDGGKARIVRTDEGGGYKGLSNDTLVLEGERLWPKVKSGLDAFSRTVKNEGSEDDNVVKGLWNVLSTANPSPLTARTHLRHTVLVKPVFFDPKLPLPPNPPPFPAPIPLHDTPESPSSLAPPDQMEKEGDGGGHWYATRVQSILMIERGKNRHAGETIRVKFWEREGYELDEEGKPRWSGKVKKFVVEV